MNFGLKLGVGLIPGLFCLIGAWAQDHSVLSLEYCQEMAVKNYPLVKKRALIEKSKLFSIANASKAYLPQVGLLGQATYQSAVTIVPVNVPGIDIPTLNKDQYKLYAELNQIIYDGGAVQQQRADRELQAEVEQQQLEVSLYQIKERVNQLYFGLLLIDAQLQLNQLRRGDIRLGLKKIKAAIANGTALKSNASILEAESLTVEQQQIDLEASRKAYLAMLGLFLDQTLAADVRIVRPASPGLSEEINRPELALYQRRLRYVDVQEEGIRVRNRPKLDFFFQGGYGRPALNILDPDFDAYYIGGLRLRWNFSGFYTAKREKAILQYNREGIKAEEETFRFNTQYQLHHENANVERYRKLLETDKQIVALRNQIKKTALVQLENGTITTNDYLKEVNAEDQARRSHMLHEIQLLSAQYQRKITTGQ